VSQRTLPSFLPFHGSISVRPERIQGEEYTVRSDVWSLGITLIELALGHFPFAPHEEDDDDFSDLADFRPPGGLEIVGEEDEEEEGGEEWRGFDPSSSYNPMDLDLEKTITSNRQEQARHSIIISTDSPLHHSRPPSLGPNSKRSSSHLLPPGSASSAYPYAEKRRSIAEKRRSVKVTGVSVVGSASQMSVLELLQYIVNEPAPKLPSSGKFPESMIDFVNECLWKDVKRRPTPKELLVSFFYSFYDLITSAELIDLVET
jgi:mitogen-activated protein kinase kinase